MPTTATEVLLSTEEVAARLGDPSLRILEVDEDTEAYGRGHLPGALAVHWKRDLQDPIRRDFIGPEAFAALMDRLAIGGDTQVILYGGNSNWFAAYAYWYFRYTATCRSSCSTAAAGPGSWKAARSPRRSRRPRPPRATASRASRTPSGRCAVGLNR